MVSLSPSSQFSTDAMFADGGSKLLTDDELCRLIRKKLEEFKSGSANESGLTIGSVFQADCSVPSSSSDVIPRSLNSFKDRVYKQILSAPATPRCTPKAAQQPEDLLKSKAELTSNKRKDCPHVQTEAAGSSGTKEDSRMSAVTREDKTCPGLPRSCSLTREQHRSLLDGNKNLGSGGRMFEVSVELGMRKGINMVRDINSNNTEDQHDTRREKTFCSVLRDPQYMPVYEDKSKLLRSELYEDVSDDDENQSVDLSEPTTGTSRTGLDEVQIKNQTRCCRSLLLQTEGGGHETNMSCSVFNQHDDEEEDWEIVPVIVSGLEFEYTDDGGCGGKTSSSFINARRGTAPNPVPASAFSQMEVFDTPAQQERAVKFGQVSFVVPSSSSNHQRSSNILGCTEELCSEAEDSCETDDSLDYSSGSESNYLTVSNQVVRNLSSSSPINGVSSDSERKNQGNQTKNSQKSSNQEAVIYIDSDDDVIVLSDSDDDIMELGVEAMAPSLISENSDFWLKEHTADEKILQDLKQSSAESSEPRPESSWDKPGTSRLIPPGEISFHEPSREIKDLNRKRMPSSETEEVNVEDLNNAGNSVCTKKTKVKLSETSGSLGPVIPRLFVSRLSREQVQLVHESAVRRRESNSSTVVSPRKKSRYSVRDGTRKLTSKFKCPKRVHNTPGSKVDRSSFEPKIPKKLASSLKGPVPYSRHSAHPNYPLRSSSSVSATSRSTEQTNHARRKVFSDWQKNHVPLRRERKARGVNYLRQSL